MPRLNSREQEVCATNISPNAVLKYNDYIISFRPTCSLIQMSAHGCTNTHVTQSMKRFIRRPGVNRHYLLKGLQPETQLQALQLLLE